MAKKMPLIISTLTLLVSGFTSAATWANDGNYHVEGPWTFDYMLATETEVQSIIDEICPYEDNPTQCSYRYTFYNDTSPIYNLLPPFGEKQIHILSLDPNPKNGKNTIEYYFNPENSYEKSYSQVITEIDPLGNIRKYFNSSSYTHTISKLYIYQVEEGHNPTPVIKEEYAELFSAPYTRMLYSGIKSESDNSLLPSNQVGDLEIEETSYDPIYGSNLYATFEDNVGNMHAQVIILSGCHQGGELCKLQYTSDNLKPGLVNKPTYEEGYEDGYNDGYNDGLTAGHNEGYREGITEGYDNGHSDGKNEGYEAGFIDGIGIGHDEGYDNGYDEGYNQGLSEGHFEGYEDGYMLGRDDGWMEGQDAGYHEGYDSGYNNGYDNGYSNGFNAARNQNENTSEGDNQDDGTDNTDSNINNNTSSNQATNDGVLVQNMSTISLGSELLSGSKPKFSIRTPNTGSEVQENYSTEFPWWLGAIFAFGIVTLIWFFVPKRKKTNKKS